jgi:hypothetical protein
MAGEPDRRPAPDARERILQRHPLGGYEEEVTGAGGATADHDLLGVEGVDRIRDPDPDPLAPELDDARRGRIPVVSGLDRVGAEDGLGLRAQAAEG